MADLGSSGNCELELGAGLRGGRDGSLEDDACGTSRGGSDVAGGGSGAVVWSARADIRGASTEKVSLGNGSSSWGVIAYSLTAQLLVLVACCRRVNMR